ncbi:MAG: MBL fold metallo-hydrolase RNA specificity domain-containing protein [Candidatus Asgardarchaeia archaeon]
MIFKAFGAARTVTGSMHYLEVDNASIILDAGRFEGTKEFERKWNLNFKFRPETVDAILISHAHNDHIGRLPILVSRGFKGKIFATDATIDLAGLVLEDAVKIEEENNKRESMLGRGRSSISNYPLFTMKDVRDTLQKMHGIPYRKEVKIIDDVYATFYDAGHIIGSSIIKLRIDSRHGEITLTYTGDLGQPNMPFIRDPEYIDGSDYVIMESTYGNRIHEPFEESVKKVERLVVWIYRHAERGGKLIVPAFAIGRTQTMLYILNELYSKGRIPEVPIYIDSPLAIYVTEVFKRHKECFDKNTWNLLTSKNNPLNFKLVHYIANESESFSLLNKPGPMIIIAGSGMLTGGRILRHVFSTIENPYNALLFTGYQATGTLGRRILDGAEKITLFNKELVVKAKIEKLDGLSAHADSRFLVEFIQRMKRRPKTVFLVHGDMAAIVSLAKKLKSIGIHYQIPSFGSSYKLFNGITM